LNFPNPTIDRQLELALAEDIGAGDVTSEILIPENSQTRGKIWAKEAGVLAGMPVAERIFQLIGQVDFQPEVNDSAEIKKGQKLATIAGSTRKILQGERLALNFLQRLSGIATQTRKAVEQVGTGKARVVDTRKTTPLWRWLEKYAVRQGGGFNHRLGLFDTILIKDNHIQAVGGVKKAVEIARSKAGHTLKIEVEVTNIEELKEALSAGPDIIMLDNMGTEEMKKAVEFVDGRVLIEASGGITLENIGEISRCGVDIISMGALTHSVMALDISLDLSQGG